LVAPTTWAFHFGPGHYRYTIHTDATIALTSDTATQQAPVGTTALYEMTVTPSSDSTLSIAGMVDSFTVSRGMAIPLPAADSMTQTTAAPFSATVTMTGNVLAFQSSARTECDSALSPVVAAARELLVQVPLSFTDSTEWQDSTSTTTCRDGIPVTTSAVHHYRVVGATTFDSTAAVELSRTSTLTIAGSGTPRYRTNGTFQITGTGSATASLYLDSHSGALLGGSATGNADVTVTTARGQLPFHQQVTQTITRVP